MSRWSLTIRLSSKLTSLSSVLAVLSLRRSLRAIPVSYIALTSINVLTVRRPINAPQTNPIQHPLIYLRGIQSYEMESILQLMYLGEGRFYQERMGEFIKVAQDLEMKDINNMLEFPVEKEEDTFEDIIPKEEIREDVNEEKPRKPENTKVREEVSNHIKSSQCPECGAEFENRYRLLAHYRSIHGGVIYHCKECDYQSKDKSNLRRHIRSKHEGVKYPCNHCDYQATSRAGLQIHVQSKHEGITYPCNLCEYQATQLGHLQRHIQSIHEGIKYPCDQCDYQATQKRNLQAHKSAKHSDTVLKCDDCDYQTKWRTNYNRHIKSHLSVIEFE